jgi:branched-chain amino acid aminotransferase group I
MQPTQPNPKNQDILVYINGQLYPRDQACVSVFDSVVQGGDAVWEGLRVYPEGIFLLEEHLERLIDSARAMAFGEIPTVASVKAAIFQTLQANNMREGVHIRLTLTRGKKVTSGMNPLWNQYGPTLIVLPEWKPPIYENKGLQVITSSIRRNPPQCVDSKIHHNNLINNILAKIEANMAGVDAAVMLDLQGFLSETNATNIFLVKKEKLYTPFADSCLPGITRGVIVAQSASWGIPCFEKNLSLTEMYTADEMFVTGTEGEVTPVWMADGRTIGHGTTGPITQKIQDMHRQLRPMHCTPLP